jgi:glucose/arabinose dehydrogenase
MATPRAPRLRLEQLEDRSVPAVMPGFAETTLATGLLQPTAMAVAPDGRIFVTEKGGNLRVVQPNGTVLSTPFLTVGVNTFSERGLIGVAFDPNFATNRFVYVYYTTNETVPVNRVSRFTADATNPNVAAAGSELILLDDIPSTNGNHNGGASCTSRWAKPACPRTRRRSRTCWARCCASIPMARCRATTRSWA